MTQVEFRYIVVSGGELKKVQGTPSWDLFLIIFFIVSTGYGFVLQRDKVIVTLLSIYAGIVIAGILGDPVKMFFQGDKTVFNQIFIKANMEPFTIQALLFGAVTVLISARSGIGSRGSRSALSTFELGLFSFLNSALILAAVFSFMTPEMRGNFEQTSKIARMVIDHQSWWFIAPIIALVATGGLGKSRSSDY